MWPWQNPICVSEHSLCSLKEMDGSEPNGWAAKGKQKNPKYDVGLISVHGVPPPMRNIHGKVGDNRNQLPYVIKKHSERRAQ